MREVTGKELNRNGKQNDTKEFAHHIQDTGTKPLFQTFGEFEDDVDDQHIRGNGQ